MAIAAQNRRGTTAQMATFTGLVGEITVDTDKKVAVVHDGVTAGGFPLAGIAQTITNGVTTSAPSQDVVYGALVGKAPSGYGIGEPSLTLLSVDIDNVIFGGKYWVTLCSNTPADYGMLEVSSISGGAVSQIFANIIDGAFWIRTCSGGVWAAWKQIATTSNAGALSPDTDNAYTLGASGYRWSQLWAATATINTSDERAKNTIVDSGLGLDFISALRPVSYKFNVGQNIVTQEPDGEEAINIPAVLGENGEIITPATTETRPKFKQVVTPRPGARTHYGLIAQEVKAVLGDTDFGGYIYDEPTDSYGLRYEEFVAPLIKAVQELTARVKDLESK